VSNLEMKFSNTLLSSVLKIPAVNWKKDCAYVFFLKMPYFIFLLTIGVTVAIIIDFIASILSIDHNT
jgi:hypothetical protein